MGMDVYGRNPKQNKIVEEFPTYHKYNQLDFKDKWKKLDSDEKLRDQYWKEQEAYEDVNCGNYFRNNCWWWRPLWNYCYAVADDIIPHEVWDEGHSNSGAGLGSRDAKKLGERLLLTINSGECVEYQAKYMQHLEELPDDDCFKCNNNNHGHNKKKDCKSCSKTGKQTNFNKSYPFDTENVRRFANFCIESGGFEIC